MWSVWKPEATEPTGIKQEIMAYLLLRQLRVAVYKSLPEIHRMNLRPQIHKAVIWSQNSEPVEEMFFFSLAVYKQQCNFT